MSIRVTIRSAAQLRRAADLMAEAKRKYIKELSVAFHDAGQETLHEIRGKVLSMNIRGRRKPSARRRFAEVRPGTALRQRMSDAVQYEASAQGSNLRVEFYVDSELMGGRRGGGNIPYHLETRGEWRHPIMGNDGAWAAEVGEKGWFYDEANAAKETISKQVDEAIDRFVAEVQGEL